MRRLFWRRARIFLERDPQREDDRSGEQRTQDEAEQVAPHLTPPPAPREQDEPQR